ncbi:MAG: methylmalonyl Co-A mutase-associated GTPase MeaB [Candidatus Latescibacteria bacterium]|nr:methylmalonyl Co-A mutase-associated GTPase MeaB [Candidatus Latescibacterota bacterium]
MRDLAGRVLAGDIRAAARAISLIERRENNVAPLLSDLYPSTGGAIRIGITGPPGAGKSTLAGCLAQRFVAAGRAVGILAVDIASPFSGGALLGDRIRMQGLANDPGVFIRSMGNEGLPGGLCRAARDAIRVLEATGKDVVLVETAGVGQTDVDVAHCVDAVVLTLVPESGDEIQLLKAGVMEIADVIALNKSERPGANGLAGALRETLHARGEVDGWETPLVCTVGTQGEGLAELYEALEAYSRHLGTGDRLAVLRNQQLRRELRERVEARLAFSLSAAPARECLDRAVARVRAGKDDPYNAAERLSGEM